MKIDAPAPKMQEYKAENLIQNLGKRSQEIDSHPKENWSGNKLTDVLSCYVTTEAELSKEGHLLKIQIDLGESFFQHAILLV